MPNRLFVYGTLQPDKAPPEISTEVGKLQLVGKGRVWGKLVDLGSYPGAMLGRQFRRTIPGLIFSLPDDPHVLAKLDSYEEFFPEAPERSLFLRRLVTVEQDDLTSSQCWIYEWNRGRAFNPALVASAAQAAV